MTPTPENIAEVAAARLKAIRERAQTIADTFIGATVTNDENLLNHTILKAIRYADKAGTAQAAVQWAISDLTPYEVLEPS